MQINPLQEEISFQNLTLTSNVEHRNIERQTSDDERQTSNANIERQISQNKMSENKVSNTSFYLLFISLFTQQSIRLIRAINISLRVKHITVITLKMLYNQYVLCSVLQLQC